MEDLIAEAAQRSARYLGGLKERGVVPQAEALERLGGFDVPLQAEPLAPEAVLAELDELGSAATVASAGPRYFGFVTGGTLPAALAANILAGAWDQNAAFRVMSPAVAVLEEVCRQWLVALFGLPPEAGIGFVTGATMANFSALAAARHALLGRSGWDVEARGLFGAPPIPVIVGAEVHVSVLKALSLLGLGRERVVRVAVDGQGRMRPEAIPALNEPAIICVQSGNVNTGAFDPAAEICSIARASDSWVHADGAFGLWAAACPDRAHLAAGIPAAHSWATDAHKWLNVPYDSGIVFVRDPQHLKASMSSSAAYLIAGDTREPGHFTPELSRRARAVEVWAALRSLGRSGLADLIGRNCRHARRFAEGLTRAGYRVLNEVALNQVLVSFGDAERTRRVISAVQQEGTCWCGGTEWQGQAAMRISVSSWATSGEDVERSLQAIIRVASG
jgi:glutamate/tyrosine decarboxylase-like PLP-dependent enzyme